MDNKNEFKKEMAAGKKNVNGQLSKEVKDYIHIWVKEHSDEINKPIFERIFNNSR